MKKTILFISILALAISSSQARNYQEQDCVHFYNMMNKYVKKAKLNGKAHSGTGARLIVDMAKRYAADAIIDCEYVRPEFSYSAQKTFDQMISIEEEIAQEKEV